MKTMPYRFAFALAALLIASPAVAWERKCHADDFDADGVCWIIKQSSDYFVHIQLNEEKSAMEIGASAGHWEQKYADTFLLRVDIQETRNLQEVGEVDSSHEGYIFATVPLDYGRETVKKMANGYEVHIRLEDMEGEYHEFTTSTDGLDEAWNEFTNIVDF